VARWLASFAPGADRRQHRVIEGQPMGYSETRVAVPRGKLAERLFHQEKSALNTAGKGTLTLLSL
jgi:hypothetical protein